MSRKFPLFLFIAAVCQIKPGNMHRRHYQQQTLNGNWLLSLFSSSVFISFVNDDDDDIIRWGLSKSQWARFRLNFSFILCCWITAPITSHSETHFLSTLHCLILSAALLWAELRGLEIRAVITLEGKSLKKKLKQSASGIRSSCICCTLSPVAACVYFCATFPSFRPCVGCYLRHVTVCPDTWPQVHLCDFSPSHFPLLLRVSQIWVTLKKNVFIWGKRKKHSGCIFSYWLKFLIIIWFKCCYLLDKMN